MKAAVFKLPDKAPVIKKKETIDKRIYSVMPRKAVLDKRVRNADIRVLAALCTYTKSSGLCWVSQLRLSEDIGIARQNVNRSIVRLKKLDYLRVQSASKPNQKGETLQVVFDADISAEDAVSIVSNREDARSPEMIERDEAAQIMAKLNPKKRQANTESKGTKAMTKLTEAVIKNHKDRIKRGGKGAEKSKAFLLKKGVSIDDCVGENTRITSMSDQSIGVIPVITRVNHHHDTNEVFNVYINIYSESKSKTGNQYHPGEYDELLAEQLSRRTNPQDWNKFVDKSLGGDPSIPFHRLAEAYLGNE